MELLGGQQGESLLKVESHLVAEHAARAGAGAVMLVGAVVSDMSQQVKILFHFKGCRGRRAATGYVRG